MSRLAASLRDQLNRATSSRDQLRAKTALGSYLARIGDVQAAEEISREIRDQVGIAVEPTIAPRILLLEGLIRYFGGYRESPLDKIDRALALSKGFRDFACLSQVAAWKAHLDFVNGNFESMREHLDLALQGNAPDQHETRSRCGLTLVAAYGLLGEMDSLRRCFDLTHRIATQVGDDATISALIFNRSAHRVAALRFDARTSIESRKIDPLLKLELASGLNFDLITKNLALPHVSRVWEARLDLLDGQAAQALSSLREADRLLPKGIRESHAIRIDMAWCYLLLDDVDSALSCINELTEDEIDSLDADDRAIFRSIRIHLARMQSESIEAIHRMQSLETDAVVEYRAQMRRLRDACDGLLTFFEKVVQ